jgi:hypothetical protein
MAKTFGGWGIGRHDFSKKTSEEEIVRRLRRSEELLEWILKWCEGWDWVQGDRI